MTFEEWGRENVSIFDDAGIEWEKTFLFEAYRAGIEAAAELIEAEGMMAAEYLARRIRELKDEPK
jgi:hypothetical protein